jgi:hypothetical protein
MNELFVSLKAVTNRLFNAKIPLPVLAKLVTPMPFFYVRNHCGMPESDGNCYQLQIAGAVAQPVVLRWIRFRRRLARLCKSSAAPRFSVRAHMLRGSRRFSRPFLRLFGDNLLNHHA